ncbi:hypothetical protein PspLS_07308 [Pyricularia sp. CBS 133598]|nr:hypothetical protein PspLS_07308 [Pyricularia sp. CBS 133598]
MAWAEMWFDDSIESDKSLFSKIMKPHKPAPACPNITSLPTLVSELDGRLWHCR